MLVFDLFQNVQSQGVVFNKPPVKMEGQNVTWNHGSMHVPNYFTNANGVPIFPRVPSTINFSSHSNTAMYHGRHSFPQYTPVGKHNTHGINCACGSITSYLL